MTVVGIVVSPCHLCGSPLGDAPVVATRARGGRDSRRVACVRCGLVQVSPAPTLEELSAYYAGDYHRDHGPVIMGVYEGGVHVRSVEPGEPEYDATVASMHHSRARMVAADLGLHPGASVLEIGCSDGRTLAELQALGMDVYGLEPDARMAAQAAERVGPRRVRAGSIDTLDRESWTAEFDAVIAFHVVEHLADPLASIARMRTLLRHGGRVWFEVPNVLTPSLPMVDHWQWVHLYDFSAYTMAALLAQAGLDAISMVDARNHAVQGWATHGSGKPRPYAHHGGPDGVQLARYLHEIEAGQEPAPFELADPEPARSPIERFLRGEVVGSEELRADLALLRDGVTRLASAYHDVAMTLGKLSQSIGEEARLRLEAWHSDAHEHGFVLGEGFALSRLSNLLAYIANAMQKREASDGDGGECE